jgi:tetratricopeptide (TPR) repeat protein
MPTTHSQLFRGLLLTGALITAPSVALAQGRAGAPSTPRADSTRTATRLDVDGKTAEARAIFQAQADNAPDAAARAAAHRNIAMSYGFDGDCANAVKYEEMVIAYWVTRESAEPQNAFYQQGEMANEAARLCIDVGQLDIAEKYYRRGSDLGNKEPAPRTHPKSLWDYRLSHALARLAARRGNKAEAAKQVAEAKRILAGDSAMATAQARFLPYLEGYVALYTGDLAGAERELTKALAIQGNATDPFMTQLLAVTYEKQGKNAEAKALWQKAYDLSTAHNPPAAYTRPVARKKIGAP